MSKLEWDKTGERLYETGISNVALYKQNASGAYSAGVAWNGVTAINESPSGGDANPLYADNIKYLELRGTEDFGLTVECYQAPKEFYECNGMKEVADGVVIAQQNRVPFGLAYMTIIGNDTEKNDYGKKLKLVYGATTSPAQRNHSTVNNSPEAETISYEMSTTPVAVNTAGCNPTSTIEINSVIVGADKFQKICDLVYGTEDAEAKLPLPDEVITLLKADA